MAEFNIRTDSVDVEQIMRQIRARIKEKRGVDYTEQQIQELANVKLERFLDPKGVRSDLVEQFKRSRGTSPEPPNYGFEDTTLYETHRGIIRFFRKLFNPFLKLLFNPNPIVHVLHMQGQINNINAQQFRVREELDALYYEVIHNLVLEVTRLGIENKNLKMRVESLGSRMDFDERRARALEGAVQYKPGSGPSREPRSPPYRKPEITPVEPAPVAVPSAPPPSQPQPIANAGSETQPGDGTSTARRRRRRRRGRRGGRGRASGEAAAMPTGAPGTEQADSISLPHGDSAADAAFDGNGPDDESGAEFADEPGAEDEPDSTQ